MVKSSSFIVTVRLIGTKDTKLHLLFPHISESIFSDYLEGISKGFSGLSFPLVLMIILFFLPNEITV
jgi:hypothetical protein